ncbi:MAG: class I SAM-dependent methyltransferase [Proteobacteria bacterium]|nr:class I SAM-dependent methyltransferase [Pseudomonadota bacterium]
MNSGLQEDLDKGDCISCGGSTFESLPYKNDLMGVDISFKRCCSCGTICPAMEPTALDEYVTRYYTTKYHDSFLQRTSKKDILSKCYRFFARIVSTGCEYRFIKKFLTEGSSMLEIGASDGSLIERFSNKGFDCSIIEPDEKFHKQVSEKLVKVQAYRSIEELGSRKRKFDMIVLVHVLEHVTRPTLFLKDIKRLLRTDGKLYIELPNIVHEGILKDSIVDHPHLYHWNLDGAKIFFKSLGFNIEHLEPYSTRISPYDRPRFASIRKIYYFLAAFFFMKDYYFIKSNGHMLRAVLSINSANENE